MNIQPTNRNTTFGARLIFHTKVKKRIPLTPFYRKVPATFVMLNKGEDTYALTKYAQNQFTNTNNLTYEILTDLKNPQEQTSNIFALTLQEENLKELVPEKILGCCNGFIFETERTPVFYLANIETLSKHNKSAKKHERHFELWGHQIKYQEEYKHLGRTLVNSLLEFLTRHKIEKLELLSVENQHPFYKGLGFVEYCEDHFRIATNKYSS